MTNPYECGTAIMKMPSYPLARPWDAAAYGEWKKGLIVPAPAPLVCPPCLDEPYVPLASQADLSDFLKKRRPAGLGIFIEREPRPWYLRWMGD
jgi:hypothetical protein